MEDSATKRVEAFYRHLFPELYKLDSKDLLVAVQVANDNSLSLEDAQHGWESQPKEFDYELEITGKIPHELKGTFFRNGPGLLEVYGTPLAHPIDGDGMICAISIQGGKAHFKSSYVKTSAYVHEKETQKCIYRGMMGTNPPDLNLMAKYKNPSNTNAYVWGDKLLSVYESGWPYALNPATLETIGRDNLGGAIDEARCVAAHGRYDHITDRFVTFSLRIDEDGKGSRVWFHEFDSDWKLIKQQEHHFDKYYYCHDLALTRNYYIIHQSPYYNVTEENITKIISGESSPGLLMRHYPEVPSGFIVVPRNQDSKEGVRFVSTPPCHIYHHMNAYEENNKIYFASVCLEGDFRMEFENKANLSNTTVSPGYVFKTVIDLANNTCTRDKVDLCSCEFPTTNPYINGEKWRYAYLMAADSPHQPVPYQEIVKFDYLGKSRQVWSAREERGIIGEPVFVPRVASPLSGDMKEDDGWVITQLYLPRYHKTQFIILDAQDLAKGPVARLHLKHHTPYGFHGTFCPQIFSK